MPWLLSPIHFLLKPNSWRSALRFILRPYLLGRKNSSSLFCLSQKFGEKLVEFRCQMSESWVAQNFQIPFDLQLFTGLAIPREWSGDHHSGFQYLWLYDLKAKGEEPSLGGWVSNKIGQWLETRRGKNLWLALGTNLECQLQLGFSLRLDHGPSFNNVISNKPTSVTHSQGFLISISVLVQPSLSWGRISLKFTSYRPSSIREVPQIKYTPSRAPPFPLGTDGQ